MVQVGARQAAGTRRHLGGIAAQWLLAALLCALALGAPHGHPQAAQCLRLWMVGPAENRVTQAFTALADALGQEASLGAAVQVFGGELTGEKIS